MTDLAISFKELPSSAVSEILDVLQDVYDSEAVVGVVIFNKRTEVAVGEITVKDDDTTLVAKVTALDAEGHETTFDEIPTWESSDETVATCNPSEDGYTCQFLIGAPGSAVVTATGIESSSGERVEIKSTGLINVTAGDAVVGSVEFSHAAPEQ